MLSVHWSTMFCWIWMTCIPNSVFNFCTELLQSWFKNICPSMECPYYTTEKYSRCVVCQQPENSTSTSGPSPSCSSSVSRLHCQWRTPDPPHRYGVWPSRWECWPLAAAWLSVFNCLSQLWGHILQHSHRSTCCLYRGSVDIHWHYTPTGEKLILNWKVQLLNLRGYVQ